MHSPGEKATALHDVTINFGSGPLLTSVSLHAQAGEVIGIKGPNGSGKTSLLRILADVAQPDIGIRTGPSSCAYVPATIDPLPLRAADWLRLFPRAQRSDPLPLLHALRYDSDLSKKLPELSFGNLRKLLLAEALSSGEPLIVIDEFTAGLDSAGSATAAAVVTRLARQGTTIVIADQQDRPFPPRTRSFEILDQALAPSTEERDELVDVTLRGPGSRLPALTETAMALGFEQAP